MAEEKIEQSTKLFTKSVVSKTKFKRYDELYDKLETDKKNV